MEFAQLANPRVYQRYASVTSGCVLEALERASRRAPRQATPGVFLFFGAYISLGLAIRRRPRSPKTKIRNVLYRFPGPERPNWCWDRPAMNLNQEQKPIITKARGGSACKVRNRTAAPVWRQRILHSRGGFAHPRPCQSLTDCRKARGKEGGLDPLFFPLSLVARLFGLVLRARGRETLRTGICRTTAAPFCSD